MNCYKKSTPARVSQLPEGSTRAANSVKYRSGRGNRPAQQVKKFVFHLMALAEFNFSADLHSQR
jgi:hypothetical protein